jgi:P27 family predicted phage terminase small subunit
MGRRGPPPDPLSGRTQRGLNSLSKRRIIPFSAEGLPKAKMPADLSPAARVIWKREAPGLERRKLLDGLSQPLFVMLCEQLVTVQELNEVVRRDGLVITGRGGRQVAHPALAALRSSGRIVLSLLREFQMTPMSRARAGIVYDAETEEDREFRRFIEGPGGDNNNDNKGA